MGKPAAWSAGSNTIGRWLAAGGVACLLSTAAQADPLLFHPDGDELRSLGGAPHIVVDPHGFTVEVPGDLPVAGPVDDARAARAVHAVRFVVEGGAGQVEGGAPASTLVHHLVGPKEGWRTHQPTFEEAWVLDILPGIDLVVHTRNGEPEYDFVVLPGVDPRTIRVRVVGADAASTDGSGALVVDTPVGRLTHRAPIAYQDTPRGRRFVEAAMVLEGDVLRFSLGDFDRGRALTIDPHVNFAGYFGGSGDEQNPRIAAIPGGGYYIAGNSNSGDIPDTLPPGGSVGGDIRLFIARLDDFGHREWVTFFGGTGGDALYDVAADSAGNVLVGGETHSTDFPVTGGALKTSSIGGDGFVAKLTGDGTSLIASTYVGGDALGPGDVIYRLGVDAADNVYVTGYANGVDFLPDTGHAFVAGLGQDLAGFTFTAPIFRQQTTGQDALLWPVPAFAVNAAGWLVVAGFCSPDDNLTPEDESFAEINPMGGTGTGCVAVMDDAGSFFMQSYFGGDFGPTRVFAAAWAPDGSVWLGGTTDAVDFPNFFGVQQLFGGPLPPYTPGPIPGADGFLLGAALGGAIVYASVIGGSETDAVYGVALDDDGNIYTAGRTLSDDFPVTSAIDASSTAGIEIFITKQPPLKQGYGLYYASYLSQPNIDPGLSGLVVGDDDLPMLVGTAFGGGWRVAGGGSTWAGGTDVILARIEDDPVPQLSIPSLFSSGNFGYTLDDADPVNTYTLEYLLHPGPELDLGGPLPVRFERRYGSLLASEGVSDLGHGWRHEYEWTRTEDFQDNTVITRGDGTVFRFPMDCENPCRTTDPPRAVAYQLIDGELFVDPEERRVYAFDFDTGQLQRISDLYGNAVTLTYEASRLSEVSDGLGRRLTFHRALPYGLVNAVSDGVRRVELTHSPTGELLTASRGLDGACCSASDGAGCTDDAAVEACVCALNDTCCTDRWSAACARLVSFGTCGVCTDPNAATTTYTYAASTDRELVSFTRPIGNTPTTQVYDGGRVQTQTDALGNVTVFNQSGGGEGGGDFTTEIVDGEGGAWTHRYTETGELLEVVDPAGVVIGFTPEEGAPRMAERTSGLGHTSAYGYDEQGAIANAEHPGGVLFELTYENLVLGDETWLDELAGLELRGLSEISLPDETSETYTYDAFGQPASRTDRNGNLWAYARDSRGLTTSVTTPAGDQLLLGYDARGDLTSFTDATGRETALTYDGVGRLVGVTLPGGSTTSATWSASDEVLSFTNERGGSRTYVYDANDNLLSLTDEAGGVTTFSYDAMDRLETVTAAGATLTLTYDGRGEVVMITDGDDAVTEYVHDGRGLETSVIDGEGFLWARVYDDDQRLSAETLPSGRQRSYDFDGRDLLTAITLPSEAVRTYTYDGLGRIAALTDEDGLSTAFTYDGNDLLLTVIEGEGASALGLLLTRDAQGAVTSIADAGGQVWSFNYDEMGRLTGTEDPLGSAMTVGHDARGRPETITTALGTASFTYDGPELPATIDYSDGTSLAFTWDALGRLTAANGITLAWDELDSVVDSNGLTMTRDPVGRLASVNYAPGRTVTYAYDGRGLLTSVADWTGATTTFEYDDDGRRVGMVRANGVATGWTWNEDDRLAGIDEILAGDSLSHIALERSPSGLILSAEREVPLAPSPVAESLAFAYDAASALEGATHDAQGRRLGYGGRSYTWNMADHLVAIDGQAGATSLTHDAFGYPTSTGSRELVWNYGLPLPSVAMERAGGADVRYFVHDADGALLFAIDAATGAHAFHHYDEAGNTLFVTDDTGAITARFAYLAYGKLAGSSGSTDVLFTWGGRHGVIALEEPDHYVVRARVYDAVTRRFLSRDPAGYARHPRAFNPYGFPMQSPLLWVDVLGTEPVSAEQAVEQVNKGAAVYENFAARLERTPADSSSKLFQRAVQQRPGSLERAAMFRKARGLERDAKALGRLKDLASRVQHATTALSTGQKVFGSDRERRAALDQIYADQAARRADVQAMNRRKKLSKEELGELLREIDECTDARAAAVQKCHEVNVQVAVYEGTMATLGSLLPPDVNTGLSALIEKTSERLYGTKVK